eukprot:CAMPEP_0194501850 /NCGR_PEP_ID=MMETSP0253-20130528/23333_1 /TAXON_ID=2966 /ORGANISM="Noctiluca scintillans" /LENGTH=152 /DNA_ID=CAMNT_0039343897 /DNA_START=48 /DNA_END=506 /DNA_ORIENTATION=+
MVFLTTIAVLLTNPCFGFLEQMDDGYRSGLCLDLPGGNAYNGAQLWMWSCQSGNANQMFGGETSSIATTIPYGDGDFCVDAGSMEEGFRLMLWECNGYPQQNFYWDDELLKVSSTDLCMGPPMGDTDGTAVALVSCIGEITWEYHSSSSVFV